MLPYLRRYNFRKVSQTNSTETRRFVNTGIVIALIPFLHFYMSHRNKESDIRIKLPQVSKEQAIIKVDENGRAYIVNLSKTNATILNGRSIGGVEFTYLNNGDEIMMGERLFLYQNSGDFIINYVHLSTYYSESLYNPILLRDFPIMQPKKVHPSMKT